MSEEKFDLAAMQREMLEEAMGIKRIQTIDGATLMDKQIEHRDFTVADILPAGLTLLVGAPKVGKSFFVLGLCLAVAKGEPFLGFPTMPGDVLYMSLEDTEDRLQNRLMLLSDDGPESLFFSSQIIRTDEGLLDALEQFVTEHPNTRLIVIDTLNYIRPESKSTNMYEKDYSDIAPLHEFTQRHPVSLVLVHHSRKTKDSDEMNAASGSTALSGAVDNYLLLSRPRRTERYAKLFCSGRDILDREMEVEMDERCVWKVSDGTVHKEEAMNMTARAVYMFIAYCSDIFDTDTMSVTFSPSALVDAISETLGIDIPSNMVTKELTRHHEQLKELGLTFEVKRTRDTRLLAFTMLHRELNLVDEFYAEHRNLCISEGEVAESDGMTAEAFDETICHAVTSA